VPSGLPRSYRLPYSVKLADRTLKARDEIMAGNPQEGLAEELAEGDPTSAEAKAQPNQQLDGGITSTGGRVELEGPIDQIPRVEFRPMGPPPLPPKP
jgi:hypothetical protein